MNWFFSLIYLIFIFILYWVIGQMILKVCNYKINIIKSLLTGFFAVYFLSFLVGVPCQILHTSWKIFFIFYFLMLFSVFLICFYYQKEIIYSNSHELKDNFWNIIMKHLKKYWFVYLLVGAFTVFSMSNALPYYQMNYDDYYYIGKIVNQVGSTALSTENFFNGAFELNNSIIRFVNTYEITYGFFASLFHISIPFFCRGTMVIHNYLLIFLSYIEFSKLFIKKNNQFVLISFLVLLICHGFTTNAPQSFLPIRMYDGWQFQTAIFYGSSVVRCMAIPCLLIFGIDLIKQISLKKIIFMGSLYCSFLSFSTIFLQYAVLLGIGFIIVKLIYLFTKSKNEKFKILYTILIIFIMFILFLSTRTNSFEFFKTESFQENMQEYINFNNYYFSSDFFAFIGPFVLMGTLIIAKKIESKMISLLLVFLFLLLYIDKFIPLIVLTTFGYFFVGLRFATSVQLMCVVSLGMLVVWGFNSFKLSYVVNSLTSILCLCLTIVYIRSNIMLIKEQTWLGSGMSENGYQIEQLTKNDEMMPDVMVNIGAYFNSLNYDSYKVLFPETINYDNTFIYSCGFIISSNRIQTCYDGGCENMSAEEWSLLSNYLVEGNDFDNFMTLVEQHDIDYIFVQNVNVVNELVNQGFRMVLTNEDYGDDNVYYLMMKN